MEGGIILDTGKENCPVRSFRLYLEKLNPNIDVLFQRPKAVKASSGPWYDAQAIGVKYLEKFMKKIVKTLVLVIFIQTISLELLASPYWIVQVTKHVILCL